MKKQLIIFLLSILSFNVSIFAQDMPSVESSAIPENLKKIVSKNLPKVKPENFDWFKTDDGYGGHTSFNEGENVFIFVTYYITDKGKFTAEYKFEKDAFSIYIPQKTVKKANEAFTKYIRKKSEAESAVIFIEDTGKTTSFELYAYTRQYPAAPRNSYVAKFNAKGEMVGKVQDAGQVPD
ncbi:MAG: hypothetical protein SFU98_14025 [Leptospiraceae bacterium]|nr:hypothetical protein [Leptospiraceae bacterium]